MYSTVFHSLLFWMVVVQAVFVGLLIMPLPSNYIRGMIIKSIDNIWTLSPHVSLIFTRPALALSDMRARLSAVSTALRCPYGYSR